MQKHITFAYIFPILYTFDIEKIRSREGPFQHSPISVVWFCVLPKYLVIDD